MNSRIALAVLLVPLHVVAQGVGPGDATAKPTKQRTFQIQGRVLAVDGQPVAGVHLHVGDPETTTTAEVLAKETPVTAADGTFQVPWTNVEGAEWQTQSLMFAHKAHAGQLLWLSRLPQPKAGSSAPIQVGDVMLTRGQRLFGRVRDAEGKPVAGALVTATDLLGTLFGDGDQGALRCSARSSAGGIVDLPGALPSGSAITVRADGFYEIRREPIAAGAPLEFALQPSGFLEGVVEADGKPLAGAKVFVNYELSLEHQEVATDERGKFRCSLRHRGRWRISAHKTEGDVTRFGRSKLGEGPVTALVVTTKLPAAEEKPKPLSVRAVTKGTGAAVRTFLATVAWGEEAGNPWFLQQLRQQVRAAKPSPDGTVELPGPDSDGVAGAVYVVAKGHAPLLQKDVTRSEDGKALTVELEAEATVAGIVRDAATGAPIAGALVSVQPQNAMFGWNPGFWIDVDDVGGSELDEPVKTAADGAFRVGELGDGEWLVHVVVDGRPPLSPVPVTLKAQEARTGLFVDVPAGATLSGKLVGEPIGAGWRVRLSPVATGQQQYGYGNMLFDVDFGGQVSTNADGGAKALAADGSFRFDGLGLGHYTLMLQVPTAPRTGGALFLPIESFRVRAKGLDREFDIAGDRASKVRGRITFPAASTALENLVVTAEPSFEGSPFWHRGYDAPSGMRAFVAGDGTFEIAATDGSYRLSVFDLALGIVVANSKTFTVKGADVTQDVAVPLTTVTIEWKGTGEKMATIARVELRSMLEADKAMGNALEADDSYDMGRGLRLEHGVTSLQLALPPGDHCLIARNNAARLRIEQNEPMPSLGKLEFALPGDGKKTLVIEVIPPPEIGEESESDPKEGEPKPEPAGGHGGR